jgi:DNA invertase Pin-like site-specific DNA recombinase
VQVVRRRAIGYLRVSTVEQKAGYGLDVQEKAVSAHAKANRWRLVDIVRDEAVSGTKGENLRPGLAQALVRIEEGAADVLLVPRLDRLARDLVLQETIIRRLADRGREVASVAEPDVMADDGQRTLIRQILGAIAQYEASLITARMRAGREMKAARGGYAHGRPKYGLRAEHGSLAVDERESAMIRRATELRRNGLSLRAIGQRLSSDGFRPRSGGTWHAAQISRLIAQAES